VTVETTGRPPSVTLPPIGEPFTLLACPKHPVSTLDLEGCSEHQIVAGDHAIERQWRTVLALLRTRATKQTFVAGERAWLTYRRESCEAESSAFAGGTLAGVDAAGCEAGRNTVHLRELVATTRVLRQ
jgi:uncharacterized protein YecT (DUF1311 family)